MVKVVLLIFSCQKYKDRIDRLQNIGYLDAIQNGGIDMYIVTANDVLDRKYIIEKNRIIIKCSDSYPEFPTKVVKAFQIIYKLYKNENFILIKSDDDCLININCLLKNKDYILKYDYVGHIGNYRGAYNPNYNGLQNKAKYYGPYMNGATGYVLSKKACQIISEYIENDPHKLLAVEKYEDKLIGDILRFHDILIRYHPIWRFNRGNTNYSQKYNTIFKSRENVMSIYDY